MPISEGEWSSISALIETIAARVSGNRNFFTTGKVIKRDEAKKLVWIEDFGDQPLPIIGFDYTVDVYDETPAGTTVPSVGSGSPYKVKKKTLTIKVQVPKIGQTVVIASELGSKKLPRCLGVIQGKDWIIPESE